MTSPLSLTSIRLLGIDGGGTTTEAWLAETSCRVLGRGTGGPSNAKSVGLETARSSLDTAIRGAFHNAGLKPTPVEAICLGLAGFDRPDDRKVLSEWAQQAGWAHNLLIVNDGDLVIAAGTPEGWGIGIIAGTGSIAVGRTKDGQTARAGGWGHLIGDEGSAYRFVLDALRLVVRRADGRDPLPTKHDPFTERICAALGVASASQIVTTIYSLEFTRARIASLAPEVLAACVEAPEIHASLLKSAGAGLAEMVVATARSLGWMSGSLPLAMAGGFLLATKLVQQAMVDQLTRDGYQMDITAVTDPVRGAVILAERALTPNTTHHELATMTPSTRIDE
jgi:N-acetylglucosamine kinase-like BadF-type ATPase